MTAKTDNEDAGIMNTGIASITVNFTYDNYPLPEGGIISPEPRK
jgi:hypothetical protein